MSNDKPAGNMAWNGTNPGEGNLPVFSLRDYFAAEVLPSVYEEYVIDAREQGFVEDWRMGVAVDAYAMADAMLRAREQA